MYVIIIAKIVDIVNDVNTYKFMNIISKNVYILLKLAHFHEIR